MKKILVLISGFIIAALVNWFFWGASSFQVIVDSSSHEVKKEIETAKLPKVEVGSLDSRRHELDIEFPSSSLAELNDFRSELVDLENIKYEQYIAIKNLGGIDYYEQIKDVSAIRPVSIDLESDNFFGVSENDHFLLLYDQVYRDFNLRYSSLEEGYKSNEIFPFLMTELQFLDGYLATRCTRNSCLTLFNDEVEICERISESIFPNFICMEELFLSSKTEDDYTLVYMNRVIYEK